MAVACQQIEALRTAGLARLPAGAQGGRRCLRAGEIEQRPTDKRHRVDPKNSSAGRVDGEEPALRVEDCQQAPSVLEEPLERRGVRLGRCARGRWRAVGDQPQRQIGARGRRIRAYIIDRRPSRFIGQRVPDLEAPYDARMADRASGEREATLTVWMGPQEANIAGLVHGGSVMKLCDEAAGLAAVAIRTSAW